MEETKIEVQQNIIPENKSHRESWLNFLACLSLGLVSLFFFAYVAHDEGSNWAGFNYFFSIPVFIGIGILASKLFKLSIKKEGRSLPTKLLSILSKIFITWILAFLISLVIQNIIYFKEFKKNTNINESLKVMVESLTH